MTSNPATPASGFLPPRWFIRAAWKIHKALYRWSGGRFGLRAPRSDRYGLAYLTTTGRRSGVERRVMIGCVECEGADDLAGGGVDDADVEVFDEADNAGSGVWAADADFEHSALVAQCDLAAGGLMVDPQITPATQGNRHSRPQR